MEVLLDSIFSTYTIVGHQRRPLLCVDQTIKQVSKVVCGQQTDFIPFYTEIH